MAINGQAFTFNSGNIKIEDVFRKKKNYFFNKRRRKKDNRQGMSTLPDPRL